MAVKLKNNVPKPRRPKVGRGQRRRVQKLRAAIRTIERARKSGDPAMMDIAFGLPSAPKNPVPDPPALRSVGDISMDTRPAAPKSEAPSVTVTTPDGARVTVFQRF